MEFSARRLVLLRILRVVWVLLFDWPTEHRLSTWTPFLSIIRFENGKLIKIKLQFPSEPPPRIYQNLFKGSLHSLLLAKRLIEAFVQSGALQKLTYKGTFTLLIVVAGNTSEWLYGSPSANVRLLRDDYGLPYCYYTKPACIRTMRQSGYPWHD